MDGWLGRVSDVGLCVLLATALAVQAVAIATTWGGGYWLPDTGAGLVVCALAVLRRRHLKGAAVAGLAVAAVTVPVAWAAELPREPGPAMALGLAVLVGSTTRTLPTGWAVGVAAGGLGVVGGTLLTGPVSSSAIPVLNAVTWSCAVLAGLVLRLLDERRRATAEGIRRDERLQLARELHDVVAHHVTGIVLQTQAARLAARKHPERVDGSLADIEAAGTDALDAMRRVVGLLRDADDAPPASAGPERLGELVERFAGHGPAVRLELPDGEPAWSSEVTSTVYRVVQEALTNVSRHARRASSVTVSVAEERDGAGVRVEVADDAHAPRGRMRHGGYGLVGMRERVEALGGTLSAGPRDGAGWSVVVTLPARVREPR